MLLRLLLSSFCSLIHVVHVRCRPAGSDRFWEIGHSPAIGPGSTSLPNHGAPWISDASSGVTEDRPPSSTGWYDTWFASTLDPNNRFYRTHEPAADVVGHSSSLNPAMDHFGHAPGVYAVHNPDIYDIPISAWNHDRRASAGQSIISVNVPVLESSDPKLNEAHTSFRNPINLRRYMRSDTSLGQNLEIADHPGATTSHRPPLFDSSDWNREDISPRRNERTRSLSAINSDLTYPPLLPFRGIKETENLWKQQMQIVLGSEHLKLSLPKFWSRDAGRLYIGDDGHPPEPTRLYSKQEWAEYSRRRGDSRGHFLNNRYLRTTRISDVNAGEKSQRLYVYLNSHISMEDINKQYFLGELKFLPINVDELSWGGLNRLHFGRKVQFVLPPTTAHDLPLIVDRIEGMKGGGGNGYLTQLTGQEDVRQTVALWSPIIFDGERHTIVLYGVARIKDDQAVAAAVARNLNSLQDKADALGTTFWHTFNLVDVTDEVRRMHK